MILSGSGKVFIFGRTILRERSIGHTREGRKIRQCSGLLLIRLNALIWLLLMERVYSVVPTKNSKLFTIIRERSFRKIGKVAGTIKTN